jgi:hypothetical protein
MAEMGIGIFWIAGAMFTFAFFSQEIKDCAKIAGLEYLDWVWMILCLLLWPALLARYFNNTRW